jgi:hypothetical protein
MAERNAAFIFRPIVSQQPDGSWRARYPGAEWSVTATSSTGATHKLHAAQAELNQLIRQLDGERTAE